MSTMARDFKRMTKAYKDLYEYNKSQVNLVISLCYFKKGDRVKLIQQIKYFPDMPMGELGRITGVDYNKEYKYIVSVNFDCIPDRYFWMPPYLFRYGDWEEDGKGGFYREDKKVRMSLEAVGGKFLCKVQENGKTLTECIVNEAEKGMTHAEYFYNTYRLGNR